MFASKTKLRWLLPLFLCLPLQAQTIDDGVMMPRRNLFAGYLYSHDSWDEYWERKLKRVNGNIGAITTQTHMWSGNYGVTDRLNIIAVIPYVKTRASQGVLQGMRGFQDLTLAGKYSFLQKPFESGVLQAIAVVSGSAPVTDYTPDFLPLSIGSRSKRLTGRFTLNFLFKPGWYLNGSGGYTVRDGVTLDRPYFYTDGRLTFSDKVDMPDVFDHVLSAGYLNHGVMATFSFSQQRTQGGGDIRRQDMPFVSNRMNFSRLGGMVMFPLPKLPNLAGQFAYTYILDGRNVGQASTLTAGIMYRFHFPGSAKP